MKHLTQFNQILAGAGLALFLSLSYSAHAGTDEKLSYNCKKIDYNRVCTFIDDFDRECTVIYGTRGAGIDCQRKVAE